MSSTRSRWSLYDSDKQPNPGTRFPPKINTPHILQKSDKSWTALKYNINRRHMPNYDHMFEQVNLCWSDILTYR